MDRSDRTAGRIAAAQQRLLVAVIRRDEHGRGAARAEIARLQRQLPRAPRAGGANRSTRAAPAGMQPSAS